MEHFIHLSKVHKGKEKPKDFNAEQKLNPDEKGFAAVFRKNSSVMF